MTRPPTYPHRTTCIVCDADATFRINGRQFGRPCVEWGAVLCSCGEKAEDEQAYWNAMDDRAVEEAADMEREQDRRRA